MKTLPPALPDFPAAHSADTDWFAVDADGHVALMKSGEPGFVPTSQPEQESLTAEVPDLLGVPPLVGPVVPGARFDLGGFHPLFGRASPFSRLPEDRPSIVAFVESLDVVREDLDAGRAVEVHANPGPAVFFRSIEPARWTALWKTGRCLGIVPAPYEWQASSGPPRVDDEARTAAAGFYVYDCNDYEGSVYARTFSPEKPRRFSELPPELQERVRTQGLALGLRFREQPAIQPADGVDDVVGWHEEFRSLRDLALHPSGTTVYEGAEEPTPRARTWLAIDRNGRVGVFIGSEGAPWLRGTTEVNDELLARVAHVTPFDAYDPADLTHLPEPHDLANAQHKVIITTTDEQERYRLSLFDDAFPEPAGERALIVSWMERIEAYLDGEQLLELLTEEERDAAPPGLMPPLVPVDETPDPPPRPPCDAYAWPDGLTTERVAAWARAGFFVYACPGGEIISAPFVRLARPAEPLLWPLLAEPLVPIAGVAHLPVRFTHVPAIHPFDFGPTDGADIPGESEPGDPLLDGAARRGADDLPSYEWPPRAAPKQEGTARPTTPVTPEPNDAKPTAAPSATPPPLVNPLMARLAIVIIGGFLAWILWSEMLR